ncbi:MAG TPA: response regulator [Leptolyngbyaceae cyanobacterium]
MKIFEPEKFLILVVDDVNKNLQLLSNILESAGYGTTFATSGQQTLERLKNIKPDLILLDLMMPEMDGLQVCEILKANPDYQEIPVIFITASQEQENVLQAFERGAVDYVTKPFSPPELLARVRTHLELKHTKDQLKNTLKQLVKARDAALEAARIKTQFLANMSHEIRTPMNAVLGMTEILLNTPLNEHQLDCLKTLKSSGENLLMIINDILDFSKLEAGAVRLEKEQFALHSVIKELIDLLTPQAEAKGIKLNYTIDSHVPETSIGDATRLRQILTNLISNAIKFTEVGEVTVKVANKSLWQPETTEELSSVSSAINKPIELLFSICDTGIGISQEDRQKLFKSFSQADSSSIRKYGGTGLGLVICKQLVQLMGGEIGCHSILGQGSTFWFTAVFDRSELTKLMPVERTDKQFIKLNQNERIRNYQNSFQEVKILVVEDSQINQKVILNQLQLLGYQADCVNNGQEALEKIGERDYNIILMDCQMPVLDGYETTEKLRQKEGEAGQRSTVVIGLTAYAMPSDRQKCLDAGMDDYLSKPATMKDLAVMLEKWSTLQKQQEENYPARAKQKLFPSVASNEFVLSQSKSPIDLERLHNITGGDVGIEVELLEVFVENIEIYLAETKVVLEVRDAIALKNKAHAIKGAAANFGVQVMSELAKKMENLALENNLEAIPELIVRLEQILLDVTAFMQELKRATKTELD